MKNFCISSLLYTFLLVESAFANLAYITNEKDNTVSVIDINKQKVIKTINRLSLNKFI